MTEPTTELPFVASALPAVAGYRIEALAGSGGMARVYRAVEEGLERPVAVKVLCAHGGDQVAQRARFEREAQVVATLQHPNIVAIYRVTRTRDGDPCIVMPWMTGSLADRSLPMREGPARELLASLLDALAHAHAAQIVHRDLKPDNVLFDTAGRPMLADFGVALRVGGDARLTGEGLAVGSARYMSPEQALGREVDGRSDLYSLGVLAYEILTGVPPYVASDAIAAALAHVEAPIPRLPADLAHWQNWLDRVLAKSPEDRYPNAAEMRSALPLGSADLQFGPGQRAASASSGRPWVLIAVSAAVLLGFGWWWLVPGAARDADVPDASVPLVAQPSLTEAATEVAAEVGSATAEPTPPALAPPSAGALYERFRDADGPWLVQVSDAAGESWAVSQSEITRAEYASFVEATGRKEARCAQQNWREPGFPQADDHPVSCVSFADAQAYAEWLSGRTGARYRLPTLAQWQQLSSPVRGQQPACDQAQLSGTDCPRNATTSVESHIAVEPGIFGLIGNVREWTRTCSWKVEKANPIAHGLRGVGRWIQRKDAVPRETRTCIGRQIIGSGFADQQPWPAAQVHAESAAFPDVGFRLVRE